RGGDFGARGAADDKRHREVEQAQHGGGAGPELPPARVAVGGQGAYRRENAGGEIARRGGYRPAGRSAGEEEEQARGAEDLRRQQEVDRRRAVRRAQLRAGGEGGGDDEQAGGAEEQRPRRLSRGSLETAAG